MSKYDLDNYKYDDFLVSKKKHRELKERHIKRQNRGYDGWHFGMGNFPVKCKDKTEFKRELSKRGLLMRDDVKRDLR